MPTTRRLKIHRERLAALAASSAGLASAGPIKALHPTPVLSKSSDPKVDDIQLIQSTPDKPTRGMFVNFNTDDRMLVGVPDRQYWDRLSFI